MQKDAIAIIEVKRILMEHLVGAPNTNAEAAKPAAVGAAQR